MPSVTSDNSKIRRHTQAVKERGRSIRRESRIPGTHCNGGDLGRAVRERHAREAWVQTHHI